MSAMEKIECPYILNGYESRADYLNDLAESNGVPKTVVYELASMLGKTEDFDGLVVAVEDASEYYFE